MGSSISYKEATEDPEDILLPVDRSNSDLIREFGTDVHFLTRKIHK
jgi:hypothetical protein